MREFTKSALSFLWAMSLFGVEQCTNILVRYPSGSKDRAGVAFEAVTQATGKQFGRVVQGVYQAGDELQRELTDLLFDVLTPEAWRLHCVLGMPVDMIQWSMESVRCLIPAGDGWLAWQELQNKWEVFVLVPDIPVQLYLPSEPPYPSLGEVVERAYALEPYAALWAVEGLGHWYGDTFWEFHETPHHLLKETRVGGLPDKSLLMLHAGVGLSIAQHYLKTVNHLSVISEIRQALLQIITLCKENSMPGYEGAALESLGLATRSGIFTGELRPAELVQVVHRQLAEIDPDVLGYFWHGVGRAIYFLPINFLPCYGSIWHAIEMVRREAADEFAWRSALAGLAWGVTMVNIQQPAIVANLLQHHGDQLSENDAFSCGVAASLMMRFDTTPEAPFITSFYKYHPDPAEQGLEQLWHWQVRQPSEAALQDYYPVLKQYCHLGELFRYQSFPALLARLRRDFGGR